VDLVVAALLFEFEATRRILAVGTLTIGRCGVVGAAALVFRQVARS